MYVNTICVHPNGHLHWQNLLQKMTKIAAVALHLLALTSLVHMTYIRLVLLLWVVQAKLISVTNATLGMFSSVNGPLGNNSYHFNRLSINLKPTL
jgi:hypothetical protein